MTTVKLQTIGSMSLAGPEGEDLSSVLSQPKRLALLVYLALALPRGFHRRDTLLNLFWTDLDEKRARNALSQSLSFLRTNLPEGLILMRGMGEVGLDRDQVTTGVEAFESALEDGRWADAVEAYIGDFLQGVNIEDAPGFEEWAAAERLRLRREAARAAWSLAQEQSQRGALVEAERNALKALEWGGAEEQPVRRFMESMARAGGRAGAMRFYETFRQRLLRELALSPSEDTLALAEAIRNGEFPGRLSNEGIPGDEWAEEGPHVSLPQASSSRDPSSVGPAAASGSRKG